MSIQNAHELIYETRIIMSVCKTWHSCFLVVRALNKRVKDRYASGDCAHVSAGSSIFLCLIFWIQKSGLIYHAAFFKLVKLIILNSHRKNQN